MTTWNSWLFWPNNVAFSVLALAVLAMLFLYAARKPMHGVIHSVCTLLSQSARFIARWLFLCADNLKLRNQSVLLAHGQESEGVVIDREFERVSDMIRKDMHEFPALQRKMMEEATRIEEDYHKCGEIPPPPPEWVGALKSVAQIKTGGDIPRKLLEDINKSIQKIHDRTVAEFRRSYEERHKILKAMQPSWRSVEKLIGEMEKKMVTLQTNAKQIDGHMGKLEGIRAKDNKTEHALTTSGFVQLAISSLVMVIALGGAFINYKLIALPMSEMVGASDYITNSLKTSDVAALVIILMEASMGLFLLESLRITQLFPRIASMDDRMRQRLMFASLTFLIILAGIESSLALMRDMLVADKASLMRDLASSAPPVSDGMLTSIPMIGQMVMGFVLPFALAFVAIPLESAVYSMRTVLGVFLVQAMRGLGFSLRFTSLLLKRFSKVLELAYDVLIVIPLMIERWVIGMRAGSTGDRSHSEEKELSKLRRAA
jgi:translation initiation factor 2B subunit (eIF-2B alpha/beta/delta family)